MPESSSSPLNSLSEAPTRAGSDLSYSASEFQIDSEVAGGDFAQMPQRLGDYVLKSLLGAGGMGQVFLAEHARMRRTVAVKMLPMHLMQDERAINRFYDEICTASRVLHPNIVAAFDAGEDHGIHYLAMEYVDGMTLTRVVATHGPMSVGQAASVIRQAAMGLLHAHRAGIVHRDVKPGNLMRSSDGTIKVVDLGLARISTADLDLSRQTSKTDAPTGSSESSSSISLPNPKPNKGRLIGTLPFMSPEQLEDPDSADSRSDIYSLGATLYFLLTAQPPFSGEYLDQVYGHRHGEIPDLMQQRRDVDLQFANIFRRMMAKTPSERYASLDEVIEDLGEYADKATEPQWLAEFAMRQTIGDVSTFAGGSTAGHVADVLAIDLGMSYAAAAEASPLGNVQLRNASGGKEPLFRMAIASDGRNVLYGEEAIKLRTTSPKSLVHCLPMYIGKPLVERPIGGRQCPPEVLMGMLLRKLVTHAWTLEAPPAAVAITVPSSYDQLHRQSILQAAQIAGLKSVRLVDRSVAGIQSLLLSKSEHAAEGSVSIVEAAGNQKMLFVGLTDQASEVAVFHRDASRLRQLATAGHWHTGAMPWLQRLVEMAALTFVKEYKIDPRRTADAPQLQVACESAMKAFLGLPAAQVSIGAGSAKKAITVFRGEWLKRCNDLLEGIRVSIKMAVRDASSSRRRIDTVVLLGDLMDLPEVRDEVLRGMREDVRVEMIQNTDIARGAAASLAAELPGRGSLVQPHQGVTSQTIGIVVEDGKRRRRILPIIPRGTTIPARTNRRLTVGESSEKMAISLVESSGILRDDWQSLGRYDFEIDDSLNSREHRARMIGFEVNINGMLTVRAQKPGSPGSTKMPPLPKPLFSEEELNAWARWVDKFD